MPGLKIVLSTDEAARGARQLKKDLETLGSQAVINEKEFKQLEDRMRDGLKADKAKSAINSLEKSLNMTRLEVVKFKASIGDYSGALSSLTSGVESASKKIALLGSALSAVAIGGVTVLGKSFLETAKTFERFETQLKTITGSAASAEKAMAWITDFTSKTPYELDQVTASFVKLKSYGMDANKWMGTLGDTAAAMGKSLNQAVEMFADAAVGEFERLKEFGVKASTQGDKVTFKWSQNGQDMVKTAQKTQSGITSALGDIFSRFEGSMEDLSNTWGGMTSNISDIWTSFQKQVMYSGPFLTMKDNLRSFLDYLESNEGKMDLEGWANDIALAVNGVVTEFGAWIKANESFIRQDIPSYIKGTAEGISSILTTFNSIPSEITSAAGSGIIGRYLFGGQAGTIVATISLVNSSLKIMGDDLNSLVDKHYKAGQAIIKLYDSIKDAATGKTDWLTGESLTDTNGVVTKAINDKTEGYELYRNKVVDATKEIVEQFEREKSAIKSTTALTKSELAEQKKIKEEELKAVESFYDDYDSVTLSRSDLALKKLDEWYDEQLVLVKKGLIERNDLETAYAQKWFDINDEEVAAKVDAEEKKKKAVEDALKDELDLVEEAEEERLKIIEEQQEAYDELYDKVYDITRDIVDDFDSMGQTLVDLAKETIKDIAAAFLSKSVVIPVYMYASESLGLSSLLDGGTEGESSSGLSLSGISDLTSLYKSVTGGTSSTVASFLESDAISSIGSSIFGEAWGTYGGVEAGTGAVSSSGIVGTVAEATPAGIISSIAYSTIGDMLGLPQSEYSGLTSGLGGAAGYSIGASIGSGFPVVGTVIGALAGGLLGSLFGEDEPDYRLGVVKGNDMSNFQGSNRVAASDSGYQYRLVTQDYDVKDSSAFIDYFDNVFKALDDVTTANINDILLNSQTGDFGRISWFDPSGGDTEASLTQLNNDLFKALQKGLVEDIGEGFDAGVFDYEFFEGIKGDEEAILDTYLGFRETVEALGSSDFLEQFTYQMEEFGLSAESAYTKVKTISDTVTSISDAVGTLADATTMSSLDEITDSWDTLIDALETARATTDQLTKAETARNEVLGANVTGLTASSIESQITSGGDLSGLVSTQKTTIAASYIAETIYDQYVAGINEEAGRLFAESDYDINVLVDYLNNLDTSDAQNAITDLQESLGLLTESAEAASTAALEKIRELEIDILYAKGDDETALAMEREDTINDLIETYGEESDTIVDLQRELWALNDAATETADAIEDLSSSVEDARDEYYDAIEDALDTAEEEYDALVDAFADAEDQLAEVREAHIEQQKTLLQEQTDAYSDAIKNLSSELSELESVAENLKEYREGLLLSDDSPLLPGELLEEAMRQFATASPDTLVEASQNLLSAGRGALTDYKEYGALFSQVQSRVSGAEGSVKTQMQAIQEQIDMASVQVELLETEISLMTETSETLMSIEDAEAEYYAAKLELDNTSLDTDIEFYEEELDRLDIINDSVISLSQATKNYQTALVSAIAKGYRSLEYNFQSELNELRENWGIGASFADGGIISGPSTGYNVMTQFHGTEMIIPESKFNSLESGIDSDLKSLIKALISKVAEDSKYNKKIHRILDRVDAGQGALLVRTE